MGSKKELVPGLMRPFLRWSIFFLLVSALLPCGLAGASPNKDAIATVNGQPITEEDLAYELEIDHRVENLSSSGNIHMAKYVDKVIDDVLVMQEARRMGLEDLPGIKRQVDDFILTESVKKLYDDEIKSKTKVTDEDVWKFYYDRYMTYTYDFIVTDSQKKAAQAVKALDAGKDFVKTAMAYSDKDRFPKEQGVIAKATVQWGALARIPNVQKALSQMKPGDRSGVLKETDHGRNIYFIVKLIKKHEPDKAAFKHLRGSMEEGALKEKLDKRSDQYLAQLRKGAKIKKDKSLLALVDVSDLGKDAKFKDDKRVVASVDGRELTLGMYVQVLKDAPAMHREKVLDNWISARLVDKEALGRDYYKNDKNLRGDAERYKDQLIKRAFSADVIYPQIHITKENLDGFYSKNKENYRNPDQYQYQEITENSMKAAQRVLKELQGGADFTWVVNQEGKGFGQNGILGWMSLGQMPKQVSDAIVKMKPGQISSILQTGPTEYKIIRYLGFKKGSVPPITNVIAAVRKAYFYQEYDRIMNGYVAQLRQNADIHINGKAVRELEQKFKIVKKAK